MDIKYLEDGQEVHVLAEVTGEEAEGYLVERVLVSGDEEYAGDPEFVPRVFDQPPEEKYHPDITRLCQQRDELRSEVSRLHQERSELARQEREFKERVGRLGAYQGLELLEDCLEGRITHYVLLPRYERWSIVAAGDMRCEHDTHKLQVVALVGNVQEKSARWTRTRYNDGSGDTVDVLPARSYEEAIAKLQGQVDARLADGWNKLYDTDLERLVSLATEYGVTIPEEIYGYLAERAYNRQRAEVEAAEERLAKARENMAAIEASVVRPQEVPPAEGA